jgi:thioredoxin 1
MTRKAIRFTANWCNPCKAYAPSFNKVAGEKTDWTFESVNIDEKPELAEKYGIRSIPATVLEVDNKLVAKHVGVLSSSDLTSKLDEWK